MIDFYYHFQVLTLVTDDSSSTPPSTTASIHSGISLLDNTPNWQVVGCVIQKRCEKKNTISHKICFLKKYFSASNSVSAGDELNAPSTDPSLTIVIGKNIQNFAFKIQTQFSHTLKKYWLFLEFFASTSQEIGGLFSN